MKNNILTVDRYTNLFRLNYEKQTGKKIENIRSCDMTDFINFYGGSIEYIDFIGNIKSAVVQLNDKKSFKIFVTKEYNPQVIKEKWDRDFKEFLSNDKLPLEVKEIYLNKYKKGPNFEQLNMELTRAFFNYVIQMENKKIRPGRIIVTPVSENLPIASKEEINNVKEYVKKMI